MLKKIEGKPAPGWPAGVYFHGEDVYRVGIIVASELPRDRATILVRIMAAGPLLPDAVADLATLPADAPERTVAEEILVHLQDRLGKKSSRSAEEEEFVVKMQGSWERARAEGRDEGRREGRDEGRREGRAEEAVRALLAVLRGRGIALTEAARERIVAETDPARIEQWIEKASVAVSLADVLDEPS